MLRIKIVFALMLCYALRFVFFGMPQKCDFHLNAMLRIKIFEIFDSISHIRDSKYPIQNNILLGCQ